jgi:hypothetical protein
MIALTIVCWPIPGTGVAQQVGEHKKDVATPPVREEKNSAPAEFTVANYRLKNVTAQDAARIVHEILWGGLKGQGKGFRLSIDERTNSLVVAGTPQDLSLVQSLLNKLDVLPANNEPGLSVRVYDLKYTRADGGLGQALRLVVPKGNFEVDPTRNAVIVSGDEKMQEKAASLLRRLDSPQEVKPRIAGEMRVRIVWLATGTGGPKPPEDLKDVIRELAKMGVEDPRLVTQTLVTALPNRPFNLEGLAGQESQYRLFIAGTLCAEAGEAGSLKISINATTAPTQVPVGRVDTEITAPLGHSVVLGMTPTAKDTSVFVVQILPKK